MGRERDVAADRATVPDHFEQNSGGRLSQKAWILVDGRQRRVEAVSELEIVETNHSEVIAR
jgi:hypothetical protein